MKTRLLLNYMSSSDSGQRTSNHYRSVESDICSYADVFTLVMFFSGNFWRFETPARRMSIVLVGGWSGGLVAIVLCISQVLVCTISLGRSALSKIVC